MSTHILIVVAALFATSAVGCSCASESDVERAASIAKQIKKTPKKAESILEEHDMTIEEFEKLMYDIAANPELSKQFDKARSSSRAQSK